MQISIIIPIYKAERYIERCLTSIVNQTFIDYEVVLVDDASPDNSLQIAEQFLQKNKVAYQSIVHKTNQKQSEARNTGIKNAKGKYLMFIDNDDELTHNEVLKQFYQAIERENVDFVSANHNVVKNEKKIEKDDYNKGITQDKKCTQFAVLETLLLTEISVSPWNKLFKKNFLVNNKLYFLKGMTLEDCLWSFNMCRKAKSCYCLSNYNYNYYYQNNPTSVHANRNDAFISDLYFSIEEILKVIEKDKKCVAKNAKAYAYFIIKISINILAIPFIMKDKALWKQHYKKLREIYQESSLHNYEKRFILYGWLAYIALKERIKLRSFKGSWRYRDFMLKLNRYNFEGSFSKDRYK